MQADSGTRHHLPRLVLHGRISAPIKVAYTLWLALLVPLWVIYHGWGNFLWLSDVALFGMLIGVWFESRLLVSMMTIGSLPLELAWVVSYAASLVAGRPIGVADYMFDDSLPMLVRGLSLFHIFLPALELWAVYRLGYHRRALVAQTLVLWVVLPAAYLLTGPEANVNYVHGVGDPASPPIGQPWWLLALMLGIPLAVHWPLHEMFKRWFGR